MPFRPLGQLFPRGFLISHHRPIPGQPATVVVLEDRVNVLSVQDDNVLRPLVLLQVGDGGAEIFFCSDEELAIQGKATDHDDEPQRGEEPPSGQVA